MNTTTITFLTPAVEAIEALGNLIACEPGETQTLERKLIGGIATSGHRNTLMPFKVIHGNDKIPSGSTVYVPAQLAVNQKWATDIVTLDDVSMVFIPVEAVRLVKKAALPYAVY